VLGDRTSGSYLHRFAWTNIVRHQIVKHAASLDDPELADYWAWRRHKASLPINRTAQWLHRAQDGRCAICKTMLLAASDRPDTPRDWEHWLATTRKTIDVVWNTANSDAAEPRLIHLHCNTTRQPPGLA
jgi:RNA-directed DNA polymerase